MNKILKVIIVFSNSNELHLTINEHDYEELQNVYIREGNERFFYVGDRWINLNHIIYIQDSNNAS